MYVLFTFEDTSNHYITFNNRALFRMICKYALERIGITHFHATEGRRNGGAGSGYREKQNVLREFAADWQQSFSNYDYSWSDLADWNAFFDGYGRRYGLLTEFKNNGIL